MKTIPYALFARENGPARVVRFSAKLFVPVVLALILCLARDGRAADAFTFANVEEAARNLAANAYAPPEAEAPDFLRSLSPEQWRKLRLRPEYANLWAGENIPFAITFLHPGSVFTQIARINLVDGASVRHMPYSPDMFETDDENLAAQLRNASLGFAGFGVNFPFAVETDRGATERNRFAGLMGASHFMFRGRNAEFGAYARPVALDTAMPSGEQHPFFREFWMQKPETDDDEFVVYALMDSPSLTGAYRFSIAAGSSTIVDVHARLFKRANVAEPEKLGLAPATGMFMHSETRRGDTADFRPELHSCDGFLFSGGQDDWRWTVLKNPQRLTITAYPMNNPRGFGLMQRDNSFDHYQDLDNRYDRASSLWVEPVGDWGPGRLELVEIPSSREYHPNILAYWIPDGNRLATPQANNGDETNAPNGDAPWLEARYRLYWMPPGATPHALGKARDTRMVREQGGEQVTFIIDFEGEAINTLDGDTGLASVVDAPDHAPLLEKSLRKNDVTGGWRLLLTFKLPAGGVLQNLFSAREGPTPIRFSAYLKKGENIAEPLTEKWTYNIIP